ncbi:MAG: SusC/RagA family TonB-linked outer membrane protein [Tannerella sp.]|jgi:TonB-linked SusC/RagA family outer membrane protein|nr:SusC/RagA family TonB-linked outer membrane protein [Tannerella sp.]
MLFFLLSGTWSAVANNVYSDVVKLSLHLKNVTVQEVLMEIERTSEFYFSYNTRQIDATRKVSIDMENKTVMDALNELFAGKKVKYTIDDRHIILYKSDHPNKMLIIQQQDKRITGKIVDATGEPLAGANVTEKGTANGTITNINGTFSLTVSDNATLQVSYIGFKMQEIAIAGKTDLNITLLEDTEQLDEIVVTALGIKRSEKALGYAVQNIDGEAVTAVKGVYLGTSLSGKIAGVHVRNSTEFNQAPNIQLRGESPLLVIDGIPFAHMGLGDVAADDIESLTVLKGSTASALYGSRGGSGAIMITTKRGGANEGVTVSVNSNDMFHAGYQGLPGQQSSYSTGTGGKYDAYDYIWGDKMDIGRTAVQYDPFTYTWYEQPLVSKGKDNFENFLEPSIVTNNNINIAYSGKNGSFRTSLNHIYNKGEYPNLRLNRFNYGVSGDIKLGKFKLDASANYNKLFYPQDLGAGYGIRGYMYTLLIWTGTDYDVRDYRNYWKPGKENQDPVWWNTSYYNNPYFNAYEITRDKNEDRFNAQFNATYDILPWMKAVVKAGGDSYASKINEQVPVGTVRELKGKFATSWYKGFNVNTEGMLMADKKIGDFNLDGFVGVSLYYVQESALSAQTNNGLSQPGFYSLNASVNPVTVSVSDVKRQDNSAFGKFGASWRNAVFAEVTGRNDWASTLSSKERSFFYPSLAGSVVLTEFLPKIDWLLFWKLRGSWTVTKTAPGIYDINQVYSSNSNVWDNKVGQTYPTSIRSADLKPQTSETWEIGTAAHLFNNKLRFDLAYYQKKFYNLQNWAGMSMASGFTSALINTNEQHIRKGVEITLEGDVVKNRDFQWTASVNWSRSKYMFYQLDETYSAKQPWVKVGNPVNYTTYQGWQYYEGQMIHYNGLPYRSGYNNTVYYYDPDWIWGFSNELKYKNFTAHVSLDGRVGGYEHNQIDKAMWQAGGHPDSDNQYRYDEVVNGMKNYVGQGVKWISGEVKYDSYGTIISDTREFVPNDVQVSYETYIRNGLWDSRGTPRDQSVQSLTFFKLREVALGYVVPSSICQKMRLKTLQLSITGQNLLLWTKEFTNADPDYGDSDLKSPSVRLIGFNIKLDF